MVPYRLAAIDGTCAGESWCSSRRVPSGRALPPSTTEIAFEFGGKDGGGSGIPRQREIPTEVFPLVFQVRREIERERLLYLDFAEMCPRGDSMGGCAGEGFGVQNIRSWRLLRPHTREF